MKFIMNNPEYLFLGGLILLLLITFFMNRATSGLYYIRWTRRNFSILDIEFPSNARYYAKITTSIKRMKDGECRGYEPDPIPYNSLRSNIYLDFLFIWPAYGCVALMCLHVAGYFESCMILFLGLALAQVLALICDVVENLMILKTMDHPKWFLKADQSNNDLKDDETKASQAYKWYYAIVRVKWIFVILGLFLSLNMILYRFFNGDYLVNQIWYGVLVIGIIMLFMIANSIWINRQKASNKYDQQVQNNDNLPSFKCPEIAQDK